MFKKGALSPHLKYEVVGLGRRVEAKILKVCTEKLMKLWSKHAWCTKSSRGPVPGPTAS